MEAIKAKFIEIVIATLVVGGLAWLLTQSFAMQSDLGRLDGATTATAQRVDRIAEALPDMQAQFAYEETHKPAQMALVATKARQSDLTGEWGSTVHLFDLAGNQRRTYNISLNGPDDRRMIDSAYKLSGESLAHGSKPIPFTQLSNMSVALREPASIPSYINAEASFLVTKPSANLEIPAELGSPQTVALNPEATSWYSLLAELSKNSEIYSRP